MSSRSKKPQGKTAEEVIVVTGKQYDVSIFGYIYRVFRMVYRTLYRAFVFPVYLEFLKIYNDNLAKTFVVFTQMALISTIIMSFYISIFFGIFIFLLTFMLGNTNAYEYDGRSFYKYMKEQWYLLDNFYRVSKQVVVETDYNVYEKRNRKNIKKRKRA